ncbi:MAG: alpha/beta hydrolase [Planctomycetota bacterium]|nr:alpha/beta hydrolase [Planctomycetota bacterium]
MRHVLAYDVIGSGAGQTVWVLHGIFGSGRNWEVFGRRFVAAYPDVRIVLVHLRGHAGSRDVPPPHTMRACAQDLERLGTHLGSGPDVVWGHSFGGKVALTYLRETGGVGLREVWSLDSPPGDGPAGGTDAISSEVGRVIAAVKDIVLPVARRAQVQDKLRACGLSRAVAGWMATNLVRGDDGYSWHFDRDVLDALLIDYWEEDLWPTAEAPPGDVQVHLVRAGRSDRWTSDDLLRLGGVKNVHVLPTAGHWLHVDDPDALEELLGQAF